MPKKSSKRQSKSGGRTNSRKTKTVKNTSGCGTAYCVKCKKVCSMNNCNNAMSKNGRKMLKGNCVTCNTKMNKFLPN